MNYYFDANESDIKRKIMRARKRLKSVKKDVKKIEPQENLRQSYRLNRYNSVKSISGEVKNTKSKKKQPIHFRTVSKDRSKSKEWSSESQGNVASLSGKGHMGPIQVVKPRELVQQFSLTNFTSHIYFS